MLHVLPVCLTYLFSYSYYYERDDVKRGFRFPVGTVSNFPVIKLQMTNDRSKFRQPTELELAPGPYNH